jgi:hypothetical protein
MTQARFAVKIRNSRRFFSGIRRGMHKGRKTLYSKPLKQFRKFQNARTRFVSVRRQISFFRPA